MGIKIAKFAAAAIRSQTTARDKKKRKQTTKRESHIHANKALVFLSIREVETVFDH